MFRVLERLFLLSQKNSHHVHQIEFISEIHRHDLTLSVTFFLWLLYKINHYYYYYYYKTAKISDTVPTGSHDTGTVQSQFLKSFIP